MGKGGMSQGEKEDGEEVNMAAWLMGVNTLKIQPFELPSLGILIFLSFQSCILEVLWNLFIG